MDGVKRALSSSDASQESIAIQPTRNPFTRAMRYSWDKWIYPRVVAPMKESNEPPRFDARGVAIGLIIGFIVPVGGQLVLITLLRLFMRFNSLLAVAFSLVSNPFNFLPLYYGYYLLGSCIIGASPNVSRETFDTMMLAVAGSGHFGESWAAFLNLSGDILIRWSVAAVLMGITSSLLGYLITYRIKSRILMRRAEQASSADDQPLQPQIPS
jgi:uncharacterized protein (DUF2062 family)